MTQTLKNSSKAFKRLLRAASRRTFIRRFFGAIAGAGAVSAGAATLASEAQAAAPRAAMPGERRAIDPYLGEIMMTGFNFAPVGWTLCDGQLLTIASNSALFSLLGTTYGGDGRTTFGLPDLRGRVPMHHGSGPGLTPRVIGERGAPKK